jgi:hypothetical protein
MAEYGPAFSALRAILAERAAKLSVKTDSATEYTLLTRSPSPFPQHKGQPMYFASVRLGKAYASFHLMPLYMCEPLTSKVSPALKKRMQGKTCFNFKTIPDKDLLTQLEELTDAGLELWEKKHWL